MKNRKTILIIIIACVAVGIIYAVSSLLPEKQAQIVLIGVAAAVVALWMILKMWNMVHLSKIVSGPTNILYDEKDPGLYVQEMEKILEKVTTRQQKDLIRINIAAGQMYNGEYDNTLTTLEQIALPGQPEVNQILCYAYEAMALFLKAENEQALELVEAQRKLFKKYENTQAGITNNIILLYGFEKLAQKEYGQAQEIAERLRERKLSSLLEDMVDYLLLECYRNEKKEGERALLKEEMRKRRVVPAVQTKIEG